MTVARTRTLRITLSDPRINDAIDQINHQVDRHENKSGHNDNGLHMRKVPRKDRVHQKRPQTGPTEDHLNEDKPFEQKRKFQPENRDHRDRGVG